MAVADPADAAQRLAAWVARVGGAARRHPERTWLIGILLIAALLRIGWAIATVQHPTGVADPFTYLLYGEQIAYGNGYRLPNGEPTAYFPPGYPAALGASIWLVRETPLPGDLLSAVGGLNVALGVGTVALTYAIGRRTFDVTTGLVAAALVAVWPNLVYHTGAILSETLFTFLVLAALAALLWEPWRGGRAPAASLLTFGALVGAAALVRPAAVALLPIVPIAFRLAGTRWRTAIAVFMPAVIAAAFVIAPWTIRNIEVMNAPVFISTNGGDDLCIGYNEDATGSFEASKQCWEGDPLEKRPAFETERDAENRSRALEFIRDHPVDAVALLPRKLWAIMRNDYSGILGIESYGYDPLFERTWVRPTLYALGTTFFYVVLAIALLGAPSFARRQGPRRVMIPLAIGALLLVPLLVFGDPRFKVPALPLLALMAAVPLARRFTRPRWP